MGVHDNEDLQLDEAEGAMIADEFVSQFDEMSKYLDSLEWRFRDCSDRDLKVLVNRLPPSSSDLRRNVIVEIRRREVERN